MVLVDVGLRAVGPFLGGQDDGEKASMKTLQVLKGMLVGMITALHEVLSRLGLPRDGDNP